MYLSGLFGHSGLGYCGLGTSLNVGHVSSTIAIPPRDDFSLCHLYLQKQRFHVSDLCGCWYFTRRHPATETP